MDDKPDYLREYEHLTLARLLLAQRQVDRHGAGRLGSFVTAKAAAVDAGREGSVLEIRMLQALAHHARGDLPQALAALSRSFADTPEPESYVRLYLDEGAPMLGLLHHAADASPHARRLLEARLPPTRRPRAAAEPRRPAEPPRAGGAAALDSELTGPEIARELYVTLNTLRTHTKRIFTKLEVTTRVAAVRRAHNRAPLKSGLACHIVLHIMW